MAELMQFPDIKLDSAGGSVLDFAKTQIDPMENQAFGSYLKAAQAQAKPLDLYNQAETAAGLPKLRQTATTLQGQVNDLEDAIRRADRDVTARSANSYVTEAQRQGMVNAYRQPLQENLGWTSQSLGRVEDAITKAGADIGTKVNLAMQGQQQELEPYKAQLSMIQDRAARYMTGFTADREAQLNLLLEKIRRQEQISDKEWDLAQELAKEERTWDRTKQQLAIEGSSNKNQVLDLGTTKALIDPATGNVIKTYQETTSGGGSGNSLADVIRALGYGNTSEQKPVGPPNMSTNNGPVRAGTIQSLW